MADQINKWGQGANQNNSGWGSGANNTIGWGSVHALSYGHDNTDLVGVPSVYVGNPITPDGTGDPTNGTAELFYRNRIEQRPSWNTAGEQLNDYSNSNNGGLIHSGGGLSFDGVNDSVDLGDLGSVRTYSFWANADTTSEEFLKINASDSVAVSAGTVTLTGQSGTVYVNGALGSTITASSYNLITVVLDAAVTADAVSFGIVGAAYGAFDLAEALFYSDAKTAVEVLQNYNNPQEPISTGLVAWYGFDEMSGDTVFDKSGNGNNAAISGATRVSGVEVGYQPALGGFNNYQVFDGVNDYVEIPTRLELSSYVINFRVSSVSSGLGTIVGTTDSTGDWIAIAASGAFSIRHAFGTVHAFSTISGYNIGDIVTGTVTFDGANINVVANNQDLGTVAETGIFDIKGFGRISGQNWLNGIIDYVEVEGIGRWSNLGGWVDEIGSNDGTVNGTPADARIFGNAYNSDTDIFGNAIANAYIPNALNFSGGYDGLYVDAGSAVDLDAAASLNIWAKPNTSTAGQRIYDNGKAQVYLDGSNQVVVTRDGATTLTSNSALTNGAWAMVNVSSDAAGLTNIYIGTKASVMALAQAAANTTAGTPAAGTTNLIIGNLDAGTNPFDGYFIYELVYAEDLSAANTDLTKINQIYNSTLNLIP